MDALSDEEKRKEIAKVRWRLLIEVLSKKRQHIDNSEYVSVRRFSSFGLLKTSFYEKDANQKDTWYTYECPSFESFKAAIRHLDDSFEITDIIGFNNTGNVCVWPAEEILTYYCLKHPHVFNCEYYLPVSSLVQHSLISAYDLDDASVFDDIAEILPPRPTVTEDRPRTIFQCRNKIVCEIGGGMTCLAGLGVAMCTEAKYVMLTDGNEKSIQNVQVVVERNKSFFGNTQVTSRTLVWNEYNSFTNLDEKFDIIICADCYFFDASREDLLHTFVKILKSKGIVFSFAPLRGNTFGLFAQLAKKYFTVEIQQKYDETVWELHHQNLSKGIEVYDENIHYPQLMKLTKLA